MSATIIRSVWTYTVNGKAMGTYAEDYCRGMYDTLRKTSLHTRVQLVRIDHVATDFAKTGRNWDSVKTVVADSHPDEVEESRTVLSHADTRTYTRNAARGTSHYFGKTEWFDAYDRKTNQPLMAWQVARVDGGREIVVNGPRGFIQSVSTLAEAVDLIDTFR